MIRYLTMYRNTAACAPYTYGTLTRFMVYRNFRQFTNASTPSQPPPDPENKYTGWRVANNFVKYTAIVLSIGIFIHGWPGYCKHQRIRIVDAGDDTDDTDDTDDNADTDDSEKQKPKN